MKNYPDSEYQQDADGNSQDQWDAGEAEHSELNDPVHEGATYADSIWDDANESEQQKASWLRWEETEEDTDLFATTLAEEPSDDSQEEQNAEVYAAYGQMNPPIAEEMSSISEPSQWTTDMEDVDFPDETDELPMMPSMATNDSEVGSSAKARKLADRVEDDDRYQSMLIMMQFGRWPDVLNTLAELREDYPNEPSLNSLLNEAQLKCEIVETWGTSINGRKLTVRQETLLRRSIPFVILVTVAFVSLSFYQSFVAPSRQVVAMSQQNKEIIAEAQALTQNAQFEDALRKYEQVLANEPDNSGALQGIQETRTMMGLVAEFDLAMQLAEEGNIERALAFLQGIQTRSPGFRNVDVEIKRLETMAEVQSRFYTAESAYILQQWLMAVPLYESISEMAADYEVQTVAQHLTESYYHAGLQLTNQLPAPDAGPEEALEYLRKGKSIDPEQAEMHMKRLEYYFDGMRALDSGKLDEAINLWQGLYDANPQYLGGYLAGRLYAAYLSLGAKAEQEENFTHAQNLYTQAMGLQVDDISSAQNRLAALIASATPTPAPTVPPAAPVYVPPPVPPTATPEPAPIGWIAFRTNRNGPEEIYLMSPDGTVQKPAPVGVAMRFEEFVKNDTISWDGSRELRVLAIDGRTDASIYMVDTQSGLQTMVTNYHGDEYDPVWSPKGDRIAFVANHTGNDEIWTANPDGTDAYQVTWNEWEWDKRPSFSPDGSQIVFYSNRSGWRQLWVMDSNGGSQYNISYNAYDDWDPVWIK